MKRAVGILSMAIAPVFAAGMALADDRGTMGSEQRSPTGSGATSGSGAASGTAATAGFVGTPHTMSGTVKDIDQEEGKLTVDAEGKELDLHFPKSAIQNLKKGDRVMVQLAIRPAGTSSGTSGMGSGSGTGSGSSGSGRYPAGSGAGSGSGAGGTGAGTGSGTRSGSGSESTR
jgi:hypothetical protein